MLCTNGVLRLWRVSNIQLAKSKGTFHMTIYILNIHMLNIHIAYLFTTHFRSMPTNATHHTWGPTVGVELAVAWHMSQNGLRKVFGEALELMFDLISQLPGVANHQRPHGLKTNKQKVSLVFKSQKLSNFNLVINRCSSHHLCVSQPQPSTSPNPRTFSLESTCCKHAKTKTAVLPIPDFAWTTWIRPWFGMKTKWNGKGKSKKLLLWKCWKYRNVRLRYKHIHVYMYIYIHRISMYTQQIVLWYYNNKYNISWHPSKTCYFKNVPSDSRIPTLLPKPRLTQDIRSQNGLGTGVHWIYPPTQSCQSCQSCQSPRGLHVQ